MKDAARTAIQNALNAAWAVSPPPCPLTWDNQPKNHEPKAAWVRASLQFGGTQPAAVGKVFRRTTAMIFLQVFIPEGKGTSIATKAADRSDRAFLFENLPFDADGNQGTISGDAGCLGPTPAGLDGGMQQYNLTHALRIDVSKFEATVAQHLVTEDNQQLVTEGGDAIATE